MLEGLENYLTRVAEEAFERPIRVVAVGIVIFGGWAIGAYTALSWLFAQLLRPFM